MPSFCFLCAVGRPHAYSKAKGVFLSPSSPKALLNHASNAWFSGIQSRHPHFCVCLLSLYRCTPQKRRMRFFVLRRTPQRISVFEFSTCHCAGRCSRRRNKTPMVLQGKLCLSCRDTAWKRMRIADRVSLQAPAPSRCSPPLGP